MSPEEKIISSLECGKMMNCGQPLDVLVVQGFGDYWQDNIRKTQKILRKLQRGNKVYYYQPRKIWVLR